MMVQKINPHAIQTGMTLSDTDVEAIRKLFGDVWCGEVKMRNWKEKHTGNYCQWTLQLPDKDNNNFTVTNSNLSDAVDIALKVHWQGVDYSEKRVYNE